jgi:hypothetical protein
VEISSHAFFVVWFIEEGRICTCMSKKDSA